MEKTVTSLLVVRFEWFKDPVSQRIKLENSYEENICVNPTELLLCSFEIIQIQIYICNLPLSSATTYLNKALSWNLRQEPSVMQEISNSFGGTYNIILDCRNIIIDGLKLDSWISEDALNGFCWNRAHGSSKSERIWNLTHICLSFYHINGIRFCSKRFSTLLNLVKNYMSDLCRALTYRDFYMFYCFFFGTYDSLDRYLTYMECIRFYLDFEESEATYHLWLDPRKVLQPFHPLSYPHM